LLLLRAQHVEICGDGQDFENRGVAVRAMLRPKLKPSPAVLPMPSAISATCAATPSIRRDGEAGFDVALADFRDEQDAVAIETPVAIGLVENPNSPE